VKLKPGMRLGSSSSNAEVMVVRPPSSVVVVTVAGRPAVPVNVGAVADLTGVTAHSITDELQIGKGYVDDESGLELLRTRAGAGPLSCNVRLLTVKAAKALPSSD
jgi:hypothetical protein